MSNSLNLSCDSGNVLLQDIDFVNKSWSCFLWLLRKSCCQLPDCLSDNGDLVSEFDDSLCQSFDDSLFNSSKLSWSFLTLSHNVFLLFVSGNQSLSELGLSFSEDSSLFSILGLIFNNVVFLKGHSSFGFGN